MNPGGGANGGPLAEYARRLEARQDALAHWSRQAGILANLRLAVFVATIGSAWFAFGAKSISVAVPIFGAGLFLVLVVLHDRVLRSRARAARAVAFYENGLARLGDDWPGTGNAGERFRDPAQAYADDLDLFGHGSLFERLCTARTSAGEAALARWLLTPADPAEVPGRQEAVRELMPRLDLREELALLGEDVRAELHPETIAAWGARAPILVSQTPRLVAALLSTVSIAALAAWIFFATGAAPFAAAAALQSGFAWRYRARVKDALHGVDLATRELELLSLMLARIEAEPGDSPRLRDLRAALETEGVPPSQRIARLRLLLDLLDGRRNQIFAPIAALLLWTTQLAFAMERWRATCGPHLAGWIEAVGEFEALSALASFAWERPDHGFAEIVKAGADGAPRFEGEGLAHPLLSSEACVRNDVRLGEELRVLVVSGSNMSGKSTLLRTVGTNAALALAGAPVCATRLSLSPVAIGASIRIHDSLLEGSSRFYAEILRLRQIVELAEGPLPVLFLLDEILHGTNSHDRGIGAEAVVRGLVERRAVGLVTTHDLALARVADAMAPRATNVHFQDHLEDGRIAFDYRLRKGVVEKSNALELMRSVGLDV